MSYSISLDRFCDALEQVTDTPELQIYQNNVLLLHEAALVGIYPLTYEHLGQSIFHALSRVYVRHHPAHTWDINVYGETFPDFLRQQLMGPKASAYDWASLSHLAALECLINELYYAPETGDPHQAPTAFLQPTAETLVTLENLGAQLQSQYPFVDVCSELRFTGNIMLTRPELRIQVSMSVNTP